MVTCKEQRQKEKERGKALSQKMEHLKKNMTHWRTWITDYKRKFETKLREENQILDQLMTGRALIVDISTPAVEISNDSLKLGTLPPVL